jgi:methionyl-tRNA formyltransferase
MTVAGKITVEDAEIDWSDTAQRVDRQVRACTPAPGAWTTFEGERFKVGPVTPTDTTVPAGEMRVAKNEVLVGTSTTAVRLDMVKPFGKKEMPAADWARGVRLETGARFGG